MTRVIAAVLLVVQGLMSLGPRVVCIAGGDCWSEPAVSEPACCEGCEADEARDGGRAEPSVQEACDENACFCCVHLPESNDERTPPPAPTRAEAGDSAPVRVAEWSVSVDATAVRGPCGHRVHPPWMSSCAQACALKASRLLI